MIQLDGLPTLDGQTAVISLCVCVCSLTPAIPGRSRAQSNPQKKRDTHWAKSGLPPGAARDFCCHPVLRLDDIVVWDLATVAN